MKTYLLEQPSTVLDIYVIFKNAVSNVGAGEVSQVKLLRLKQKNMIMNEMIEFFSEEIGVENFNLETINAETVNIFKNLVKSIKENDTLNLDIDVKDDADDVIICDESDSDSDSSDEINKTFNTILDENKKFLKKLKCKIRTVISFIIKRY